MEELCASLNKNARVSVTLARSSGRCANLMKISCKHIPRITLIAQQIESEREQSTGVLIIQLLQAWRS